VLAACSETQPECARAASLKNSVNGPRRIAKRAMERAVLTFQVAFAKRPARAASAVGTALALAVLFWCAGLAAAQAQEVPMLESGGCVASESSINCVSRWAPAGNPYLRFVPQPLDEAAIARAKERDKRWAARCRPVIEHDRYGVSRYRYAQPGCEFGVGAD
jgi:hypothetical protein